MPLNIMATTQFIGTMGARSALVAKIEKEAMATLIGV